MAKRTGKYAHIIDSLPRLPGVDPDRRDLVEAVKREILAPPGEHEIIRMRVSILSNIEELFRELLKDEKRTAAGRPWAAEFARAYAECRAIKDRLSEWESSLNLLIEAYQWLMVDQMEVEGISSMKLSNGQPVSTFQEPYAQVTDKEAFRVWCLSQREWVPKIEDGVVVVGEDGLPVMVPEGARIYERMMALPWQTTNAITKELLLNGEAEPDGVTCYAKTKVRLGGE